MFDSFVSPLCELTVHQAEGGDLKGQESVDQPGLRDRREHQAGSNQPAAGLPQTLRNGLQEGMKHLQCADTVQKSFCFQQLIQNITGLHRSRCPCLWVTQPEVNYGGFATKMDFCKICSSLCENLLFFCSCRWQQSETAAAALQKERRRKASSRPY